MVAVSAFVTRANRALDEVEWGPEENAGALSALDHTLEVLWIAPIERALDRDEAVWVESRILARKEARESRDCAAADAIRAELASRGIVLEDTAGGTRWRKVAG